jgi:hypothetical protein
MLQFRIGHPRTEGDLAASARFADAPNVAISAKARVAGQEAVGKALRMTAQPMTARRPPGACAAGPDGTEAAMTSSF